MRMHGFFLLSHDGHTLRELHHLNVPTPTQVLISSFLLWHNDSTALLHMFLRLFQILEASWYRALCQKNLRHWADCRKTLKRSEYTIAALAACSVAATRAGSAMSAPGILTLTRYSASVSSTGAKNPEASKRLCSKSPLRSSMTSTCGRRLSKEQQREILWPQQYNHVTPLHDPIALFLCYMICS